MSPIGAIAARTLVVNSLLVPEGAKTGEPIDAIFWLKMVGIIGVVIAQLYAIRSIFSMLSRLGQGLGPHNLRLISLCVFIPQIPLIAIAVDVNKEAIVALLGTIGAYLLGGTRGQQDDQSGGQGVEPRGHGANKPEK